MKPSLKWGSIHSPSSKSLGIFVEEETEMFYQPEAVNEKEGSDLWTLQGSCIHEFTAIETAYIRSAQAQARQASRQTDKVRVSQSPTPTKEL